MLLGKPSPSTELTKAAPCLSINLPIVRSAFLILPFLFVHKPAIPWLLKIILKAKRERRAAKRLFQPLGVRAAHAHKGHAKQPLCSAQIFQSILAFHGKNNIRRHHRRHQHEAVKVEPIHVVFPKSLGSQMSSAAGRSELSLLTNAPRRKSFFLITPWLVRFPDTFRHGSECCKSSPAARPAGGPFRRQPPKRRRSYDGRVCNRHV